MDKEIYKADPAYRKQALRVFVILTIVGAIAIGLFRSLIASPAHNADPLKLVVYMRVLISSFLALPIIFAAYIIQIAKKTYQQKMFPPEGMRVLKDTELLRDNRAQKRAIMLVVFAVILILCCIFALVIANTLISMLATTAQSPIVA